MTLGPHLIDDNWVVFVAAHTQRVALQLEVDRGVVITHVRRHLDAGDLLGDDVGVLHGQQRDGDADHLRDVVGPSAFRRQRWWDGRVTYGTNSRNLRTAKGKKLQKESQIS